MSLIRQQVNLYQPAASLAPAAFSFASAVLALVAVILCLIAIGGYDGWRVRRLERDVELLKARQARQAEAFASAGLSRSQVSSEAIEAQLKTSKAELASHTQALEALRSGAAGGLSGFSPQLIALAHHPIDGLWIDHLVLAGSGPSLSIAGHALDPDVVPRFLRELAAEPALVGARFDTVVIERPDARQAGPPPDAAMPGSETFRFRAEAGKSPAQQPESSEPAGAERSAGSERPS